MAEPKKKLPAVKTPAKSVSTAGAGDPRSVKPTTTASKTTSTYSPTKRTRKADRFEVGPDAY